MIKAIGNIQYGDAKDVKNELRNILQDAWKRDSKMVDYCLKQASGFIRFADGRIVIEEKPSINTHFCFDDSDDYEGACNMARYAKKSQEYFKSENLKDIDRDIQCLIEGRDIYTIRPTYYRQSESNPLRTVQSYRWYDYEEYGKAESERKLTEDEMKALIELKKYERSKFEKRINSYLKRYGMSKVHTWTYWGME